MIIQPAYCDDLKRWDGYQRKRRKFGVNVVAPSSRGHCPGAARGVTVILVAM